MRRWPVLLAALLFLLSGCAPQARELDGMALVRVLGVDGGEEVTLTAVCGGTDQGDVSRGAASAADFQSARQALPWVGEEELALTKLDVLSYMEQIPVCVAYDVDGEIVKEFPFGSKLDRAKPIYEYMEGWKCDISRCRKESDLPEAARAYIQYLQCAVGCKIRYVSVGADRDEYVTLR